jgi:hypothetical protein
MKHRRIRSISQLFGGFNFSRAFQRAIICTGQNNFENSQAESIPCQNRSISEDLINVTVIEVRNLIVGTEGFSLMANYST